MCTPTCHGHSCRAPSPSNRYPTFCHLAGVDPTDQDASKGEYPDVDGVNVWPYIEKGTKESDAAHDYLWVTSQVLIKGDYKVRGGAWP